jgi:hypothetical protein
LDSYKEEYHIWEQKQSQLDTALNLMHQENENLLCNNEDMKSELKTMTGYNED